MAANVRAQDNTQVSEQALAFNANFKQSLSDDYMAPPRGRTSCTNGLTVTGNILAAAGGALIGWPIGTYIGGGEPEWVLAGIGAGLVAIAIPLAIIGNKKCRGYSFNNQGGGAMYAKKIVPVELGLAAKGNSVGLQLSF